MKKIVDYLLVVVMLFALQSCSNDDEPKHVDPEHLSGEWYLTNIRGWEYDDDAHNKKSEFNETFIFDGKGIPVSDNAIDAHKINISIAGADYMNITDYYWDVYDKEWKFNEAGEVKLKDNQLIDGTMKVTITRLSDTSMTTYQKDEDGETYITYTKLLY